jgi:hypothetical protein
LNTQPIKSRIEHLLREYFVLEGRPSHLIVLGMILAGALINLFIPRGWTVWPFVLAFGILTYINEASSRNGQGVPPFQVYSLFVGIAAAWVVAILILWSINPLILLVGIAVVLYRVIEAFMRQRERDRLIAHRRAQGLCVHCGEVYDPHAVLCESCGEEPNPDAAVLRRVAQICHSPQDVARARSVLTRSVGTATASSKEQALLARHHGKKAAPAAQGLPKAAKLGPSSSSKRRK